MPIYEFHCPRCHKKKEVFRGVGNREAPLMCDCGGQMYPISVPAPTKTRGHAGGRPTVRDPFKKV